MPVDARDASASPREYSPLRRSADFRRVLGAGRRRRIGGITVISLNSPAGDTRIGLVVGRSVGKSVTRNRAKRRLRHALAQVPLEQGMDHVIIADRSVVNVPFAELRGWLQRAGNAR